MTVTPSGMGESSLLRYLTAGESHGQALVGILEGLPAGVPVDVSAINRELRRRQAGYGRGQRMEIEADAVVILSGVRFGLTIGSPIALLIPNRDWENWREAMAIEPPNHGFSSPEKGVTAGRGHDGVSPSSNSVKMQPVTRPRPGHADLAGAQKYAQEDLRNILERASARETAIRVAIGALTRAFLNQFGIDVFSLVLNIGGVGAPPWAAEKPGLAPERPAPWDTLTWEELKEKTEASPVRCPDANLSQAMMAAIDGAKAAGDSLGGIFEIRVKGLPPGLGSHVHWDRRLDGRLAAALMSIQAIKGVEIGLGFQAASRPGSLVHDEILYEEKRGFFRRSNHAGGLEGGITNGEDLVLRAVMKPIPTLYRPLASVDLRTKEPFLASVERSDTCAVPAAAVVGEAVVAFEVARAFLEKFGGDSLQEVKRNYEGYLRQLKGR